MELTEIEFRKQLLKKLDALNELNKNINKLCKLIKSNKK